jgi:hypothetical protein
MQLSTILHDSWPRDQQTFAKLIANFVEGCGFERPLHAVVIDARGTNLA